MGLYVNSNNSFQIHEIWDFDIDFFLGKIYTKHDNALLGVFETVRYVYFGQIGRGAIC